MKKLNRKKSNIFKFSIFFAMLFSSFVYAESWDDFWWRPDQQGEKLFVKKEYQQAAAHFEDPLWAGAAYYRAKDYKHAFQKFSQVKTAVGFYNQANALAYLGEYEKAIEAYEQALKLDANMMDAKFNRDLLKKLLKQNSKNNSQNKKNKESSSSQNNASNNQNQQNSQEQQNQSEQKNVLQQQNNQSNGQLQNNSPLSPSSYSGSSPHHPSQNQFDEEQQADDQLLRRIPDESGGLLRQKFLRDFMRRHMSDAGEL